MKYAIMLSEADGDAWTVARVAAFLDDFTVQEIRAQAPGADGAILGRIVEGDFPGRLLWQSPTLTEPQRVAMQETKSGRPLGAALRPVD